MSQIRKVLIATDFSEHAERAVETGVELAKQLGAVVHVVHAFHLPVPLIAPYEVAIPDPYLDEARQSARERLQATEEKIRAAGLETHSHLTEVPAASGIVQVAEDVGADLVVMGTRGNTGIKHVLLGSVAERTLRLAPCSVLTVKMPEEE
ncbi:MAG: universal stress protein [Proteobacteria bacterium]|nr:universal stress protein [Pseudomonadota bacterium]